MYVYPYGDSQQLNLDWIINKLKELEDREASAADLEEIANVFIAFTHSSGTQYRRYDYCYYQGKLYRALNDNIGAFNLSDWMEVRLGDDIPILTRLINAIDAAAVVDVKFDTSGTNGKLQQKYNNAYHDVVEVDYTPVQNSKRPLSSNAGYELNNAIHVQPSATLLTLNTSIAARGFAKAASSPLTRIVTITGRADNYHDGAFHAITTGVIFTIPDGIRPIGTEMATTTFVMMDGTTNTYELALDIAGNIINNFSSNVKSISFTACYTY